MVTKSPTTNLLNKFSQLFNKSGSGDSELSSTSAAAPRDAATPEARQKRRENAVRASELNQLRSIIQDGRATERRNKTPASSQASAPPRSSRAGALERNSLLDKIDGAEAHHVQQWWGTGPAALTAHPAEPPPAPTDEDELELDFTGMLALSADAPLYASADVAPMAPDASEPPLTPLESCLRDASLHYAEGDFDTAEHLLTAMLADPATDSLAAEGLVFSLFDVYRCSGQQDRFDALALDYAQRFGRSPGEWYAIAAPPTDSASDAAHRLDAQRNKQTFWRCPAVLDLSAWADCLAHHPVDSQVLSINWLPLQHIDPALAPVLARQFAAWSESPVELQWVGLDTLLGALRMGRLGSNAADAAPWWLMQLDLLCMAQQPQAFEELALEYCVALEMSPPSWKAAACKLVQADDVPTVADFVATLPSDPADADAPSAPYATHVLQGNVTGKNPPAWSDLALSARSVQQIAVSCARLGRVDLEAAVALRAWLQECQSRQCTVVFTHLPHLVRVYFEALGLQELAVLASGSR